MRDAGAPGGAGGRGPEDLRLLLRQWRAPEPPPQIEDELRRTFRGRRPRGRARVGWLAAAAVVAVVAVGLASQAWLARTKATATQRPPDAARGGSASRPAPTPGVRPDGLDAGEPADRDVEPSRPSPQTPESPRRGFARHALRPRLEAAGGDETVVVEAGQAALLAQLGTSLGRVQPLLHAAEAPGTRELSPATASALLAAAPAMDAPRYRGADWEVVEGEWPLVQRAVPSRER